MGPFNLNSVIGVGGVYETRPQQFDYTNSERLVQLR